MNKVKHLIKLKRKAFKLWSEKVRLIGMCELCGVKYKEITPKGKPVILNAHHLLDRYSFPRLSWDIKNGICVCQYCHKFSKTGCHRGSIIFNEWYRLKYPENYQYLLKVYNEPVEITVEYMENIIKILSQMDK